MRMKKSFKRLALVASLAFAGLFGVASEIINYKTVKCPVVEEARADSDNDIEYDSHGNPTVIYLKIAKDTNRWNDGLFYKDNRGVDVVFYDSTGTTGYDNKHQYTLTDIYYDNNYWIGKVSVPDADGVGAVEFCNGDHNSYYYGAWTYKYLLPSLGSAYEGYNMYIVTTNNSGGAGRGTQQECTLGYFDRDYILTESDGDSSGTLFFVPNEKWLNNSYDISWFNSRTIYPYIYYAWNEGSTRKENASWPGEAFSSVSNSVYKFTNIPLVEMIQITIVFNNEVITAKTSGPRLNFNETARKNWWDGSGQKGNTFGMYSNEWYDNVYENEVDMITGNYDWCTSETVIAGSILNEDINWDGWPVQTNILKETSTSFYSIDLDFVIGDEFQVVWYDELKNVSANNKQSKWLLYGQSADSDKLGRVWNGYDKTSITVYDDCINKSTAIGSDLINNYISKDDSNGNIKINHAGRVTISNTSNREKSDDKAVITMRWHDDSSRTFTPSSILPNNVYGSFNQNDHNYHPIEWNASTGRYEALCGILAGDTFRFGNNESGISISSLTLWNSEDISVSTTTPGAGYITINNNTDFYSIGWYYQNTNPDGDPEATIVYFIDRTHMFTANRKYDEECGEAFALRVLATPTCSCTSTIFTAINTLLSKCSYDTEGAFLSNYSYYDYDFDSYEAHNHDYSQTEKSTTHKTNMAIKYQWLQWAAGGGVDPRPPHGLGNFSELFNAGDSSSTIVIIVASSLSLLSVTALSVILIRKKHKRV